MLLDATSAPLPDLGTTPRRQAELVGGAFIAGYSSPHTRDAYRIDLRLWLTFLDELDVADPIHDVTRSHVELFMRDMELRGRMPSTIARRIGTLSRFYEWLVDEEYLDRNPTRRVKRPAVSSDSNTPWLSRRQLADWIDAGEELGGYDAIVALVLGLNALRVGELCSCNVESLGEDRYHHTLRFIGKGSQPAVVPLPPRSMQTIARTLDGRTSGPLVLNRYGNRSTRINVARSVSRIARSAGIGVHISPHSIRHSAVTAAFEAGHTQRDVQAFARHRDPRSTQIYDRSRESLDRHVAYALVRDLA
jgi:site-specific recombinase XerC